MSFAEADKLAHAFAVEMSVRPHLRPSGTRHRAELDTMSIAGAAMLARKIEAFWAAAGFHTRVDIVPFVVGSGTVYALRSNLLAGFPRGPADKGGKNGSSTSGATGFR
jgi:hypothetical protein